MAIGYIQYKGEIKNTTHTQKYQCEREIKKEWGSSVVEQLPSTPGDGRSVLKTLLEISSKAVNVSFLSSVAAISVSGISRLGY